MFASLELEEIEEFDSKDRILSIKSAMDYLIALLNKAVTFGVESLSDNEETDLTNLIEWAKLTDEDNLKLLLNGAFYEHSKESFSNDVMLAVNEAINMDETISGSVSKFELYNECSYKYFLTYILKLNEREEFALSSIDMGNFCHEAIERYIKELV